MHLRLEDGGGRDDGRPEADGRVDEGFLQQPRKRVANELWSEEGEDGDTGIQLIVATHGRVGHLVYGTSQLDLLVEVLDRNDLNGSCWVTSSVSHDQCGA